MGPHLLSDDKAQVATYEKLDVSTYRVGVGLNDMPVVRVPNRPIPGHVTVT